MYQVFLCPHAAQVIKELQVLSARTNVCFAQIFILEKKKSHVTSFSCVTRISRRKKSKATIDLWIFRSEHNLRRGNIMQHNIGYITEHTWKLTTEAWIEMEITLDRVLIRKDTIQGKSSKVIWSETFFTVKEIERLMNRN